MISPALTYCKEKYGPGKVVKTNRGELRFYTLEDGTLEEEWSIYLREIHKKEQQEFNDAARLDVINDAIDEWHRMKYLMPLHSYLNWTYEEYARWLEDTTNLPCRHPMIVQDIHRTPSNDENRFDHICTTCNQTVILNGYPRV